MMYGVPAVIVGVGMMVLVNVVRGRRGRAITLTLSAVLVVGALLYFGYIAAQANAWTFNPIEAQILPPVTCTGQTNITCAFRIINAGAGSGHISQAYINVRGVSVPGTCPGTTFNAIPYPAENADQYATNVNCTFPTAAGPAGSQFSGQLVFAPSANIFETGYFSYVQFSGIFS